MRKVKVPFPKLSGFIAAPTDAASAFYPVFEGGGSVSVSDDCEFAVVDVCGPLTQHATAVMAEGCAVILPSYDRIKTNFLAALASDAKAIVLRIDSPGGDFAGCLELATFLRERARASGKRLIAYTDSGAQSAAYAIACAADEIVITDSAFVGSIGVWAALADQTALDRAMGLNIAIVASGSQKAERNPHMPITEASIANLQTEVDTMANLFFGAVVTMRGIPLTEVVALQGSSLLGRAAIAASLADRIVNGWEEFTTTLNAGVTPMGYKDERGAYRSKLAKLAADDSEDGKEARSALVAMDQEDEKKAKKAAAEEDPKEDVADAKSADDDKGPVAKAEDDKEPEKEAKAEDMKEEDKKAAAAAPTTLELASKIHALEAQIAADKMATERTKLLASRPDFSEEVRATLEASPLSVVKNAVATWKRIASPTDAAASALTPGATRGNTQTGDLDPGASKVAHQETEAELVARKMGFASPADGQIVHQGRHMTLNPMTPEQVVARLAELGKKEGV